MSLELTSYGTSAPHIHNFWLAIKKARQDFSLEKDGEHRKGSLPGIFL